MNWVVPYFTKQGEWFGPTGIFSEHRERAATVARLCGEGPKRILELGSGAGGAAAATADLGHTVVAVELAPSRAEQAHVEGEVRTVDLDVPLKRRYGFDPVTSRVSIELWPMRRRKEVIKQWIRCYAPADLLLLLEGTGLRANLFEVDGEQFHIGGADHGVRGPIGDTERYLVKLVHESP